MNRRLASTIATLAFVVAACGGATPPDEEVNLIGQISIGEEHGCLVESQYGSDGNGPDRSVIWCWGDGSRGELGDGSFERPAYGRRQSSGAVQVLGIENAVSVTVVSNDATCAVARDTGLYCWGEARPIGLESSVWSSMGSTSGSKGEDRLSPVKIMDGVERFAVAGITNTAPEGNYACITRAYLDDTGVYCWGAGLGTHGIDYTSDWTDAPTAIEGLPEGLRAEELALTDERGCALLADQSVWCWQRGQVPARVDERAYLSIEAGEHRVCGVATDSALYCWGRGFTLRYGGRGYGSSFSSPTELDRFGLVSLSGLLSVGDEHVCVDYRRGVYCYGANDRGQLGDGGTRSRERLDKRIAVRGLVYPDWSRSIVDAMPTGLRGDTDYFEISAMSSNRSGTCTVVIGRVVACWGAAPLVRPDVRDDRDYLTPVVLTFNR
jgi:hypothetical protein